MNKMQNSDIPIDKKMCVASQELQEILGCGRWTAEKIGRESKSVVKVGKRKLYNLKKISAYIDAKSDMEEEGRY